MRFATERSGKPPSKLSIEDIDVALIGQFLDYLEKERANSARTRNARLSALRSFFRYVALNEPAYGLHCQRILAIPAKRHERRPISYLERVEIEALLLAPDTATWTGRRDRTLLMVAIQTGLRVSELIGLRGQDVVLGAGAHVRCQGKGRKQRCTPLRQDASSMLNVVLGAGAHVRCQGKGRKQVSMLKVWLAELKPSSSEPLFPSIRGGPLSRDAVERLVAKHTATAEQRCPSLKGKKVTPHVLRHTTAMQLLHHGVDRTVIALWLGHESVETTQMYLHADLKLKEKALSRIAPFGTKPGLYRPDDQLLGFLEGL